MSKMSLARSSGDNKEILEGLAGMSPFSTPHADYNIGTASPLQFVDSSTSLPIQIADVIGGFVMRYVQDVLTEKTVSDQAKNVFFDILKLSDMGIGAGVNFVTTRSLSSRLHR